MIPRRARLVWLGDTERFPAPWQTLAGLPVETLGQPHSDSDQDAPTVAFVSSSWLAEYGVRMPAGLGDAPLVVVSDGDEARAAGWAATIDANDVLPMVASADEMTRRLAAMIDVALLRAEHRLRATVCKRFVDAGASPPAAPEVPKAPVLLVGNSTNTQLLATRALGGDRSLAFAENIPQALRHLESRRFAAVALTGFKEGATLELAVRSLRRFVGRVQPSMLLIVEPNADYTADKALEWGIDDAVDPSKPIEWVKLRLKSTIQTVDLRHRLVRDGNVCGALAIPDAVTGAATHGYFHDYLSNSVNDGLRHRQSVIAMNLVGLSQVNASFGHAEGDRLLREFAGVIGENVRAEDLIGRIRGATFAAVLNDVAESSVPAIIGRIRAALEDLVKDTGRRDVHVDCGWTVAGKAEPASGIINRAFSSLERHGERAAV